MKPSRYNLFVRAAGGDAVLAANLLSRAVVELCPDAFATFEELARGSLDPAGVAGDAELAAFVSMLRDGMFLLDDGFDELAYIRLRTHQERFDRRQLGLVIAPTLACNFGCHYCFEEKGEGQMSAADQDRVVRLVAENLGGRESLAVQWFGGEPLLSMSAIERLSGAFLSLCGAAGVGYAATVITNGFLMTPEVSRRLGELGVRSAQVTLDGDKPLHDRTRHERGGAGSFDAILDNVRHASRHFGVKLRVHVGAYNLESVRNLVGRLAAADLQTHVAELYFAPLFNFRQTAGGAGGSLAAGRLAYYADGRRFLGAADFARVQVELLALAQSYGFRLGDPLDVSYGICTAVRDNTLVIDALGNLSKCYKDVGSGPNAIGTVATGQRRHSLPLLRYMDVPVARDAECGECTFLPVCLGGCSKQWHEGAPKETICTPLRYNFEDRLRLHYGAGEHAVRHAGPPITQACGTEGA